MTMAGLGNYVVFIVIFAALYGIVALGLNVQWGMAGLFNAGIAGFFAVGAYATAILTGPAVDGRLGGFGLPVPLGLVGAMLVAVLVAWPVGRVCLRLRADYLAIATLGVAEIIRLVLRSEDALGGGMRGIDGIPHPFDGLDYGLSQLAFLALMLALTGLAYLALERLRRGPWGRMMRAIRDNEVAAAAMGKDVAACRMQAFLLGAALMGLGGALLAHFNRAITPDAIDPMIATFLVWIMLILGGSGNHRGALAGALLVWTLWSVSELVTGLLPVEHAVQAQYARLFLIGLAFQLVLRWRPEGLFPEPIDDRRLH